MRALVGVMAASIASGCVSEETCKDATTHFYLHNRTDRPVQLFEGYEANTLQVSTDQCFEGIPAFTLASFADRETTETSNFCDDDVRVFAIAAGPQGERCGGALVTIPKESLKHEIFVAAWYVGEGEPEPLIVHWSEEGEPHS